MPVLRPTALLLALALLVGTGAPAPTTAGAVDQGDAMAEAPRACCQGQGNPCATPCPPDDGRSVVEAVLCCASGDRVPHKVAIAPEAPARPTADVALVAAWAVAPAVPPAPPRPGDATRHGPPRPSVRSHLAVSVLLI